MLTKSRRHNCNPRPHRILLQPLKNRLLLSTFTTISGHGGDFVFHFNVLPGDLDGSGKVDINDLAILAAHWQQAVTSPTQGDLDGSDFVDINDLASLAANWQAGLPGTDAPSIDAESFGAAWSAVTSPPPVPAAPTPSAPADTSNATSPISAPVIVAPISSAPLNSPPPPLKETRVSASKPVSLAPPLPMDGFVVPSHVQLVVPTSSAKTSLLSSQCPSAIGKNSLEPAAPVSHPYWRGARPSHLVQKLEQTDAVENMID